MKTYRQDCMDRKVEQLQHSASDHTDPAPTRERGNSRIMYIECKDGDLTGEARIGRVRFSRTGRTLYYQNRRFQSLKGAGFKSNYFEVETGVDYWISGPRKDGCDRLYGERVPVEIDEEVREEYWIEIRGRPDRTGDTTT